MRDERQAAQGEVRPAEPSGIDSQSSVVPKGSAARLPRRVLTLWVAASLGWLGLSSLPFAFVGESFGMTWFSANQPLSGWMERAFGMSGHDWKLISLVSAVNAVAFGAVLSLPWFVGLWILPAWSRTRRPEAPDPRADLVDLREDETLLASVTDERGRAAGSDAIQARIRWLIEQRLRLVVSAAAGWDRLYCGPRTGLLWEADYPHSERQGGGPLRLARIDVERARAKYGSLANPT